MRVFRLLRMLERSKDKLTHSNTDMNTYRNTPMLERSKDKLTCVPIGPSTSLRTCVKRDLISVKRDLVSVKRALWSSYGIIEYE
jgi:hypothetical protein